MQWITHYGLYLFDFDGVLVNTEHLHYLAYKKMCYQRGFELLWDWKTYSQMAMFSSDGLQQGIYAAFPALYQQEPNWKVLYKEKKTAYVQLLQEGHVTLMPGVEELLNHLGTHSITRCVVTHSPQEHIDLICEKLPLLKTIPYWITREHYIHPKPSPECYLKAIELYGKGKKIIGFEDSPRGFQALYATKVDSIFVSTLFERNEIEKVVGGKVKHFPSFESLLSINHFDEE